MNIIGWLLLGIIIGYIVKGFVTYSFSNEIESKKKKMDEGDKLDVG